MSSTGAPLAASRASWRAASRVLLLVGVVGAGPAAAGGCQVAAFGTEELIPGEPPAAAARADDAGARDASPRPDARAPWAGDGAPTPAVFVPGPPVRVGCADGTREGYVDLESWPDIAGCAGGWSVPGLLGREAATPQCRRTAGNGGENPQGRGCAAADLCAEGWHVCRSPEEVARRSPSDCESAAPPGVPQFFAVAMGATSFGICSADPEATNDLQGCGTFGLPGLDGCAPLERRLDFGACAATQGVWSCGGALDHGNEASVVTKSDPRLGGVLCCRD